MLRHIFSLMGSDKSRGVLQEIRMLKTVGTYTEIHKGDEGKIKEAYKRDIDRELMKMNQKQ